MNTFSTAGVSLPCFDRGGNGFCDLSFLMMYFCLCVGPTGVGLNELKRKLLISDPQHFSVTIPRKFTRLFVVGSNQALTEHPFVYFICFPKSSVYFFFLICGYLFVLSVCVMWPPQAFGLWSKDHFRSAIYWQIYFKCNDYTVWLCHMLH